MPKNFSAIAGCYSEEPIQTNISIEDALKKMEEVFATYKSGTELTSEEVAAIKPALAAIGSDETSISSDGAFQGSGNLVYNIEGARLNVKVDSELRCRGFLDRRRMQWIGNMTLQQDNPNAKIYELVYHFRFISFSTGPNGEQKVLTNAQFTNTYTDDFFTTRFSKGEAVDVARFDTSTNSQWGFCIMASCDIAAKGGSLTV